MHKRTAETDYKLFIRRAIWLHSPGLDSTRTLVSDGSSVYLPLFLLFRIITHSIWLFVLLKCENDLQELELRIETQKQTLAARDESIKKLLEMLQTKGMGKFRIFFNLLACVCVWKSAYACFFDFFVYSSFLLPLCAIEPELRWWECIRGNSLHLYSYLTHSLIRCIFNDAAASKAS